MRRNVAVGWCLPTVWRSEPEDAAVPGPAATSFIDSCARDLRPRWEQPSCVPTADTTADDRVAMWSLSEPTMVFEPPVGGCGWGCVEVGGGPVDGCRWACAEVSDGESPVLDAWACPANPRSEESLPCMPRTRHMHHELDRCKAGS